MKPEICALTLCLVILGLLGWCRSRASRDSEARDHLATAMQVVSTFLGVFGALYFTSRQSERETQQQLENMMRASLSEVRSSILVVREIEAVARNMKDADRLVLESPARVLSVLVEYPPFVERTQPDLAAQLILLSSRLTWKIDLLPIANGSEVLGADYMPISADPRQVERDLDKVVEILDSQITP